MDQDAQVQSFVNELDRLVERYRQEFDLRYLDAIGALEMKKLQLAQELMQMNRPPGGVT